MELKGKVAWVTGGATGIGGATSKLLHEEGCKLLVTSRRKDVGDAFVSQFGDDAMFVSADIADIEALEAAAAKAVEKWGRMDLLFNSAGVSLTSNFLSEDPEVVARSNANWEQGIRVGLTGPYHASRIAARYMIKNEPEGLYGERGAIVLVASMAADKIWSFYKEEELNWTGGEFAWSYGSSKAGLLGLSRDLAVVLGPHGIRVNTLKPGLFITDITGKSSDHTTAADMLFVPRQIFPNTEGGQPEQCASMAVELFKNSFMNRAEIAIDAGVVG